MAKFHINDKGVPGKCTASIRDCPIGPENHGESLKEVMNIYENKMKASEIPTKRKNINNQRDHIPGRRIPNESVQQRRKEQLKRSSKIVALGTTAVLAVGLSGCSSDSQVNPDYVQLCVNQQTHQRVDDKSCDSIRQQQAHGHGNGAAGALALYYMSLANNNRSAVNIPAVGGKVSGGTTKISDSATFVQNYASKGGSISKGFVSKGGFGKASIGDTAGHVGVGHAAGHAGGGHAGG